MAQKFINNAKTILNGSIAAGDLVMTVRAGDGALFPALGVNDFFYLTLIEYDGSGNEVDWEIVKVTGVSIDTLTIVRAQEGTTAQMWISGTKAENRFTAGTASSFAFDADISVVGKTNDYNDLTNKPDLSVYDDVVVASTTGNFPATGNTNRLYIATGTGYFYRWNGSAYVQLKDQSAVWGQITGSLINQTDLNNALNLKIENLNTFSTTNLSEGANLYYTNARAIAAIKGDAAWKATNWDTAHGWGNHATAGYTSNAGDITAVTAGTGLTGGGTSGAVTLNLSTSGLAYTAPVGTDELVFNNAGVPARYDFDNTPLSIFANDLTLNDFSNDAGFTTNVGDITSVTVGTGLSGGATSGVANVSLSFSGLPLRTPVGTDEIIFSDAGVEARVDFDDVPLSIFNNDLPTLAVNKGGTGLTSHTPTGFLQANGTGTSLTSISRDSAAAQLGTLRNSEGIGTVAAITVSTAAPTGGANGDIWLRV